MFINRAIVVAVFLGGHLVASDNYGHTQTYWDCCKPACAWPNFLQAAKANGNVQVCDRNDRSLSTGQGSNEKSACDSSNAGNGFLCSSFAPQPISNDLSYAFALTTNWVHCCSCYELTWLAGEGQGKRVQVQIVNIDGSNTTSDSDDNRGFTLLVPGGGGGVSKGCQTQYGSSLSQSSGPSDCETMPSDLQGGCYWRWNWAQGQVDGWPVSYTKIQCPNYLSGVSGCSA